MAACAHETESIYQYGVEIIPRLVKLDFGPVNVPARDWFGSSEGKNGDGAQTAIMQASSLLFPQGEKFSVRSVARFADHPAIVCQPRLRQQLQAFAAQEHQHSAHHHIYNRRIHEEFGVDVAAIDRDIAATMEPLGKYLPYTWQLGVTAALEHYTAMLAHELLTHTYLQSQFPEPHRTLWVWHAVEEVEHKAVAFDVFQAVTSYGGFIFLVYSYLLRVIVYMHCNILFPYALVVQSTRLLYHRGLLFRPSAWLSVFRFMFVHPGVIRRIMVPFFAYFSPFYHPWQQDDRLVLNKAIAQLNGRITPISKRRD